MEFWHASRGDGRLYGRSNLNECESKMSEVGRQVFREYFGQSRGCSKMIDLAQSEFETMTMLCVHAKV